MKKVISLILVAILIISSIAVSSFAVSAKKTHIYGESSDKYSVSSADKRIAFPKEARAKYKEGFLKNDNNYNYMVNSDLDASEISPLPDDCLYTGKAIKPKLTSFKGKGKTLKLNKDYTIYGYEHNKKPGYGRILIKGIGKYTGKDYVTFHIHPRNVTKVTFKRYKKYLEITAKKGKGADYTQFKFGGFFTGSDDWQSSKIKSKSIKAKIPYELFDAKDYEIGKKQHIEFLSVASVEKPKFNYYTDGEFDNIRGFYQTKLSGSFD